MEGQSYEGRSSTWEHSGVTTSRALGGPSFSDLVLQNKTSRSSQRLLSRNFRELLAPVDSIQRAQLDMASFSVPAGSDKKIEVDAGVKQTALPIPAYSDIAKAAGDLLSKDFYHLQAGLCTA